MRSSVVALALLVVLAGCAGTLTPAGDSVTLVEEWQAGESSVAGNHHAVAAGRVDGEAVIAVPIGGRSGEVGCKLLVLDGAGNQRWTAPVPTDACTIHAVADPALADFLGDETPELLVTSTEREAVAYDPLSGERLFGYPLANYGYTRPVVADATGDGAADLVVTDIDGTLAVVAPDGSTAWRRPLAAYSWSAPSVGDFDADGGPETVVGLGNETVVAFDARGRVAWTTAVSGAVTWSGAGNIDTDEPREFLAASPTGVVTALDGRAGTVEWTRSLGAYAAVGDSVASAAGARVYATNQTGTLFALEGSDGSVAWTRDLTAADTQMTPPPVAGDVTGDGTPELVAVTNDGRVAVVDTDGSVLATYHRDAAVYTHATLADTDGDGRQEVYVLYGDGTVVALTAQISSSASS
ncbi:PQQ-binding-like beta-propeller repeat protein [Halosegnis sp.]|uniref:outer membrane protein assembly factor BamB family protein n=1 Tax=Halosegnis sp. TaxID=2864959 RepID=UPI0035D4AF45